MQPIEIIVILIAISIVVLPIVICFWNRKNKKVSCSHNCLKCGKYCK